MALKEGAWSETALITISKYANSGTPSDLELAALTETIDIDLGDKDIDQIVNLKGGRLVKKTPQALTTITFEGYPVEVGPSVEETDASETLKGISQLFSGGTWNTTQPITTEASRTRDLFRIAILWTDDANATSAAGSTSATSHAYRIVFAHAYMTSMKPSFTDGILKFTFSFKVPAFNKNGVAQIREESSDGTVSLPALNPYNATYYDPDETSSFDW